MRSIWFRAPASASVLIFAASLSAQPISLRFPLSSQHGQPSPTPYTAQLTAVLDHTSSPGGRFYCHSPDRTVLAYTGELGVSDKPALHPDDDLGLCLPNTLRGYGTADDGGLLVNGRYFDTSSGQYAGEILYYDGHSGYDFPCSAAGADEVVAAAAGTIFIHPDDPVNGNEQGFNTIMIQHQVGVTRFQTWYLHTADVRVPEFSRVNAGDPIATCSDAGVPGRPHLHLEVRLNGLVIDPYGWEWDDDDPLALNPRSAVISTDPLWEGSIRPTVSEVELSEVAAGLQAVVEGLNFHPNSRVSLWHRRSRSFLREIIPSSLSSTRLTVDLGAMANPRDVLLKVGHPSGPRSRGVGLRPPQIRDDFEPLTLVGDPAAGGGTYVSFSRFFELTNSGELYFEAFVDLDGDGSGDELRIFTKSATGISRIFVPGIGFIGSVEVNDAGAMAFDDRTGAIFYRPPPPAEPIEIVRVGQPIPFTGFEGTTYSDLAGPWAINDRGDVLFSSGYLVPDPFPMSFCCTLFLYSATTKSLHTVVRDGDSFPGGSFTVRHDNRSRLTVDGDVVFPVDIDGIAGTDSFFLFSPASGEITRLIGHGDPAPGDLGGTLDRLFMRSIAGHQLVFTADVIGGSTSQAIFTIPDIRNPSTIHVIAHDGQATGTEVGGVFGHQSSIRPFEPFGGFPEIRADGGVIFLSRLVGAQIDGNPTDRGIFLWQRDRFRKIAVNGDPIFDGTEQKTQEGVSSHVSNDTGKVVYFVAGID